MAGNKNSGGARIGAGRKVKPLADKILEGHRNIKTTQFKNIEDVTCDKIPEPKDFLTSNQRQGRLIAAEVREEVWNWLKDRKCEKLISMLIIDQFAMTYSRWIQLEEAISEYGYLSKHPTTGQPIQTPFASIAHETNKQALTLWNHIYTIVRANCTDNYNNDSDDMMEKLLSSRGL
jgi:hypothetical protein